MANSRNHQTIKEQQSTYPLNDLNKFKEPKTAFGFKAMWHNWQSLDSQNCGSWPVSFKVVIIGTVLLVIGLIGYTIPLSHQLNDLEVAENQQEILLESYREKESKTRHLNVQLQQVNQLEQHFQHQLLQVPQENNVSELMAGITRSSITSGTQLQDIGIEPEIEQESFYEQPIRVVAEGDYHSIGLFINGLTLLPRIITLHDFEVAPTEGYLMELTQLTQLTLVLNIKTYRLKSELVSAISDTDGSPSGHTYTTKGTGE